MREGSRRVIVLTIFAVVGCSACASLGAADPLAESRVESRIQRLRREQAREQGRLVDLQLQVAAAHEELLLAQDEAARRRCEATAARIEAKIAVRRAECLRAGAAFDACLARNSSTQARSSLWGCLLGLGAALATAGAAAPLTVAGCGAGLVMGSARAQECGEQPVCLATIDRVEAEVLREEGMTTRPVCMPGPTALAGDTAPSPTTVVPPDPRPTGSTR